jgi:hypothetical protein
MIRRLEVNLAMTFRKRRITKKIWHSSSILSYLDSIEQKIVFVAGLFVCALWLIICVFIGQKRSSLLKI